MQPIELQEQNISIHLPCKPFRLAKQRISGKDIHLHFASTEDLICPECGAMAVNYGFRPDSLVHALKGRRGPPRTRGSKK